MADPVLLLELFDPCVLVKAQKAVQNAPPVMEALSLEAEEIVYNIPKLAPGLFNHRASLDPALILQRELDLVPKIAAVLWMRDQMKQLQARDVLVEYYMDCALRKCHARTIDEMWQGAREVVSGLGDALTEVQKYRKQLRVLLGQ